MGEVEMAFMALTARPDPPLFEHGQLIAPVDLMAPGTPIEIGMMVQAFLPQDPLLGIAVAGETDPFFFPAEEALPFGEMGAVAVKTEVAL